jgi:hypothetical protein
MMRQKRLTAGLCPLPLLKIRQFKIDKFAKSQFFRFNVIPAKPVPDTIRAPESRKLKGF